jgi:hypothetical protein
MFITVQNLPDIGDTEKNFAVNHVMRRAKACLWPACR